MNEQAGVIGRLVLRQDRGGVAWLTMNREGIRRLAAEELGQPTSPYRFADTLAELEIACAEIM